MRTPAIFYRLTAALLLLFATSVTAQSAAGRSAAEQFDRMIADAKNLMQVSPRDAIDAARRARTFAEKSGGAGTDERIATTDWLEGEALVRLNRLSDAKPLVEHGLTLVHRAAPDSRLEGDLLLSRGGIAVERADVGEALSDYQYAHRIFQHIGEERSQSRALIQIASLYTLATDYRTALKYFNQALDVYHGDPGLLVSLYNGRGNALVALERFGEAERDFNKALSLTGEMNSPLLKMVVLSNIARTQIKSGHAASAEPALAEGIRLAATPEGKSFQTMLYGLATQAALDRGESAAAGRYAEKAFAGVDIGDTTLIDRDAHEAAYKTYTALHRDDLALPHLVALKRLDDEATALARSTNAALMAARFDFANQEVRIAKLKADDLQKSVAYERASARTQRWVLLGGVGVAALIAAMLGVGLVTIRRSRNEVRAANVDLAESNTALGKALAAKTEFLATTSHEIRTPLNGILGMTQIMLADPGVAENTRDRVRVVHAAGVTMRALVDDILDVAKMETGNLTIEEAPFALDETLGDAARMWREQAVAKGLAFGLDLADCPGRVMGDSARVRQILFNLVSNAIKFTPEGAVSVTAARAGADRWRLTVADTGIGIAPDQHDEIFESFRQADAGTTRQFGGTGLGLSICRNLAVAMGGTIALQSTPGRGSRFTVELPLVPAPEASPAAIAAEGWLVVDRNPITRAMLRTIVAACAETVEAVGSLDEAAARVDAGGVVRIVADESVAADDDALAALASRVPMILLAAGDRTVPGVETIVKPITRDALIARLNGLSNCEEQPLVSAAA